MASLVSPLKAWRYLIVSPDTIAIKPTQIFSFLIRAFLTLFLVSSVALFSYFVLSDQVHRRECDKYQQKVTNFTTPADGRTDLSHIVFGIGGSVKTWHDRRRYSELWWSPNITRGFVWLDEKPPDNATWPSSSPPYMVSGDTSGFSYTSSYGSRSAIRVARIVKESFELGLENVRWFVMGDDDTVFFPENLVTVLSKYDHNQLYYIGGNSESVEQGAIHSYTMAFGGGGFAISYPLAEELVRVIDGCINRYASFYGSDQKVQACMSEIGVPLTKELGFHQVDIRGNPYGLLAAHPLAPLVSLHHLDYIETIFPGTTQVQSLEKLISAYQMDPSRILQHSFCYDLTHNWSISLSWGYTVQLNPSILTAKELETIVLTFRSWRSRSNGPFTFNTRPMRSGPCKGPLVYFLDTVESVTHETRTTYIQQESMEEERNTTNCGHALTVNVFNVSASTLNPNTWKLAPRRQCCEVLKQEGDAQETLQIYIRDCHHFETVIPY